MRRQWSRIGNWVVVWAIGASAVIPGRADTPPKPYLMAALGDSVTAAFVANTELSNKHTAHQVPVPGRGGAAGTEWWRPAVNFLENKKKLSWFSGDDVPSHYLFLNHYLQRTEPGSSLVSLNLAVTGAKAVDVVAQSQKLLAEMASGKYKALKYVTLMVGANDLCDPKVPEGTPDATLRSQLDSIFDHLDAIPQTEPIRVLVVGVMRLPELGTPAINGARTTMGVKCGLIHKLVPYCTQYTTWETLDEYHRLLALVEHKNELIHSSANQSRGRWPHLMIHYTDKTYRAPLFTQLMAADCYHPNKVGQSVLSTTLWGEQPWFPFSD